MHTIQHRPAFVEAHPELKADHREAQSAMFGAAHNAGLPLGPEAKDAMIDGINKALGRRGSRYLISRKQLRIEEMNAITEAIENGLFGADWTWNEAFTITVRSATVRVATIEPRAMTRYEMMRAAGAAVPTWIGSPLAGRV